MKKLFTALAAACTMAILPIMQATPAFASGSISGVNVYVGYADDLRANPGFPVPWIGDTATTCAGSCTGSPFDAGAVRLDNVTSSPITIDDVSVNIHGNVFDLWGSFTIPALSTKILTQTTQYNFDTSDFAIEPCGTAADPTNQPPTVTITPNGGSAVTLTDSGHVLDTFGYDSACLGNESLPWQPIGSPACTSIDLGLAPATQSHTVGTQATVQGTLSACGSPLPNTKVSFMVQSGPNAGANGTATTDSSGVASFTYTGSMTPGTDQVNAQVTNVTGGTITSNDVKVNWTVPFLSSGSFVVGDKSMTGSVNWWGSQWAMNNSLSNGGAPSAFKGFAANLSTTTPTCGGTWTTSPGNTPGEPASVPGVMAVIVSSKVTQSGNTISGDIAHIVLVKTDAGYQADPGHRGTGMVIGTVC